MTGKGLLKKLYFKSFVKISGMTEQENANFQIFRHNSMAALSYHSNRTAGAMAMSNKNIFSIEASIKTISE